MKDHKFMTMEAEKRERVINAALKEFSKGYMAANTDVIVKEAGISKGMLFHYFGSKRGLFLLPYSSHMVEAMQKISQRSNHEKTLFKEGIDSEKAQNIIIWTMNGFIDSLFRYGDDINAYKAHYEEMVKELDEYLQLLRKILYIYL